MTINRSQRAKKNIYSTMICRLIMIASGFLLPRLYLSRFGSEIYGATTSVIHFLAYISLLEGGIGGVARAVLYKPLAENDVIKINHIFNEIRIFFRYVAYIFSVYILVLAVSFKYISNIESLDWLSSFLLVIAISISVFAEYYFGIANMILLQADQKSYVTQNARSIATIANLVVVVVLIHLNFNIVTIKLISGLIFVVKPIILMIYVKNNYQIISVRASNEEFLTQKWTGLGQHLAYFLHTNTAVIVLTLLSNLKTVSVYSIYYMIIYHIQNITSSFTSGMEALFGDMIARNENKSLLVVFRFFETIISVFSIILFSVATVQIIPFIKLYTNGVNDVNYIEPSFSILLILSSLIYCLRLPYHSITIAAGHFEQTKYAAYGEAIINVVLSVVLVHKLGLTGVAIGTLVAVSFRYLYYAIYLSKNICHIKISDFIKRIIINFSVFCIVFIFNKQLLENLICDNYLNWIVNSCIISTSTICVVLIINFTFYKEDILKLIGKYFKKAGIN